MAPQTATLREETVRNIEGAAGDLMNAANRHLDARLAWYRALPAQERSWVGLIAQTGISTFVAWCRGEGRPDRLPVELFGAAPRDLTRAITLRQTVDLVRSVVEVVEDHVVELAAPGDETALSFAVLRFSREVAFATAQVYANAAESRGAWDARLESLVVDAVLRGEADDEMVSRATALGWGELGPVTVVVGSRPTGSSASAVELVRAAVGKVSLESLIAVQGRRLVVILGGSADHGRGVHALLPYFSDGPVVVGPTVPRLFAAGRSARAALSGLRASPAWPGAPRPVPADDLLPERVLLGDAPARHLLIERVYYPLQRAGGSLAETAAAFLDCGRGIEAAARALYVHPNTVRYRLGRIAEVVGYDLTEPREAHIVQTALALGALDATAPRLPRRDP
ncbi:PucR family transcriptional regulator [Piscicoccus intestinalis]|uniref:PucR family transcriptional regulator n=1 Tax=Piscicoccus intestinalis TaxID=746033 RepID=UPI0008385B43|nr:PucR family transcriptional regulator [Piscicoccus intestinalis]